MSDAPEFPAACPAPLATERVQLAHGGGGRLMRQLIERVFLPAFDNPALAARHDAAVLDGTGERIALTTDSYVVTPLFFPGGDIGKLAVYGTINDLAMVGATPRWLTAGFVLEEGLPLETLERVVASMKRAADAAGVSIVAGDTKVVDRRNGDGLYINTAGVGTLPPGVQLSPARVQAGDVLIVSGDLGRHGVAVLSVREGVAFESDIESDCASLCLEVRALLDAGVDLHCLRDLTRGGLASALNEIALDRELEIEIDETAVPVEPAVRGACELLGLDPLYVANEGRFVAFVAAADAERTLQALRATSAPAARIGQVSAARKPGRVSALGPLGAARLLDLLSGEQLPRIC